MRLKARAFRESFSKACGFSEEKQLRFPRSAVPHLVVALPDSPHHFHLLLWLHMLAAL